MGLWGRAQGKKDEEKPKVNHPAVRKDTRKTETLRDMKEERPVHSPTIATLAMASAPHRHLQRTTDPSATQTQPRQGADTQIDSRTPTPPQHDNTLSASKQPKSIPALPSAEEQNSHHREHRLPKPLVPNLDFQPPPSAYDSFGRPTQGQPSPVSTNKSRRSSISQSTEFCQSPSPSQCSSEILSDGKREEIQPKVVSQVSNKLLKNTQLRESPDDSNPGSAQLSVDSVRSSSRNRNPSVVDSQKSTTEFRERSMMQAIRTELSQRRDSPDDSTDHSTHRGISQDQEIQDFGPIRTSSRNNNRQNRSKSVSTPDKERSDSDLGKRLNQSQPIPKRPVQKTTTNSQPVQQQVKQSQQTQSVKPQATAKPSTQVQQQQSSVHHSQPSVQQPQVKRTLAIQQPQPLRTLRPKEQSELVQQSPQSKQSEQSQPVKPLLSGNAKSSQVIPTSQQQRTQPVTAQENRDSSGVHAALAQAQQELDSKTRLLEQAEEEIAKWRKEAEIAKEVAVSNEQDLTQAITELDDAKHQLSSLKRQREAIKENCIIKHGGAKVWEELEQVKQELEQGKKELEQVKMDLAAEKTEGEAEKEAMKDKMKIQYAERVQKMRESYQARLEQECDELENEHQEQVLALEEHNSQLAKDNEEMESSIERLQTEHTTMLADKDRICAEELLGRDRSYAIMLEEYESRIYLLKETHGKELQEQGHGLVKAREACSELESRSIEDAVKIKDLESRLVESLQARVKVVQEREEHIDNVVRSFNVALVQLQNWKTKDLSNEKERLMAEMGSLTKESNRHDSAGQKMEIMESAKRDSGQPSPEEDSQVPILERQGTYTQGALTKILERQQRPELM